MRTETSSATVAVKEKRREPRYPTHDAVEVKTLPYSEAPMQANVLDVSKSGMKLEIDRQLLPGSRIEILMPSSKLVLFAQVRYCRRFGALYYAGVLIEDVVPPKRDAMHLGDNEISRHLSGRGMGAAEVLWIESHLSWCDACKQEVEKIKSTMIAAVSD